MIIEGNKMKEYRKAKRRIEVSVGESVRILRELQELSQNELADLTGIPQSTISAIERDRVNLGVERAKVLARALRCHPAVLVFPGWDVEKKSAADESCQFQSLNNGGWISPPSHFSPSADRGRRSAIAWILL
jgi:transcriptional regulator with XRE-family HTH domain